MNIRQTTPVLLLGIFAALFSTRILSAQTWYDDALTRIEQHRKADLTIEVIDRQGNLVEGATVNVQMNRHAFRFGTAVKARFITGSDASHQIYRDKVLENFNSVVFENDLKWPAWDGLWGNNFNWPQTQQAMDWLDAHNLPIRGHYLSWATWSGADAYGNSDDTSTLQQRLFDHITAKATTVGNRVAEWDVINHPIGWTGTTYETHFGDQFYGDIIDHARSVAPDGMEMWVNEDNILAGGALADEYERVIQNLIDQGSAPDGIGFQGHFKQSWGRIRTGEFVYDQIERFSQLSDRLQITEFDVDVGNDDTLQAELLHDYMVAAFSHESMEGITMWGFWEDAHWLPDAALYNSDWSEKEALVAYQDLVFDQWWTEEMGLSDAAGEMSLRGFLGDYTVTVTANGKTYQMDYELSSGNHRFQFLVSVPEPASAILVGFLAGAIILNRRRQSLT